MKPRNPRQGKWNQSSTRIPKSRARQPSLPAITAICVCKDKEGSIKTLVYQSSPNGGKAQQHNSSPQEQLFFFFHFTVSVYEGKAKCLKRPAQVVGSQGHAHQTRCSPAAGVWQTRGYCSQRSPGTTGRKFPFPNTNPLNTLSRPAWQQQTPKDKGALKKKKSEVDS